MGRRGGAIDDDVSGDGGEVAGKRDRAIHAKLMVELPDASALAAAMAARSEPAPESFRLLTTNVDTAFSSPR